jgi:hypothetical protein
MQSLVEFVEEHWATCAASSPCYYAVLGFGGAATAGAALAMVPTLLTALGFSAIGPVAGSLAAAYQSAFGATALFSTLQSVGMAGMASSTWAAAGGIGTAASMLLGSFDNNPPPQPEPVQELDAVDAAEEGPVNSFL